METHTINATISGRPRRETRSGRQYLVAPVAMITQGVLAGSRGPLYYSIDAIAQSTARWDGMPITLGHPTRNGQPTSARHPEMMSSHLGHIYGSKMDHRTLRAEAWFDVELTGRLQPDLLRQIESGAKVEVSTGLFSDDQPVGQGSSHGGTPFVAKAMNITPDHLAVLLGQHGACSVADGCGINNHANGCQCQQCLFADLREWAQAAAKSTSPPVTSPTTSTPDRSATMFTPSNVQQLNANVIKFTVNGREGIIQGEAPLINELMANASRTGVMVTNMKDDRDNLLPSFDIDWDSMCAPELRRQGA